LKDLTIAIPTFNRNTQLQANLSSVLRQNLERVVILVIDNSSDIPVEQTLKVELETHPNILRVVRNKVNVGLAGNFIKCIEFCETKWMWLLSDDDLPTEHSVGLIKDTLIDKDDYTFINFSTHEWTLSRNRSFETTGMDELVCKVDSFQNLLFFSSGVYNVSLLSKSLRFAVMYTITVAPHLALLFCNLGKDGKVYFSEHELVKWKTPDIEDTWSMIPLSLGLLNLLHLPMQISQKNFKRLAAKLAESSLPPKALFLNLLLFSRGFTSHSQLRYIFHLIFSLRKPFATLNEYLDYIFLSLIVRNSHLFKLVANYYLTRKVYRVHSDRFNRV
jgi:glycosyltransferase involved in cell wall biosynthesis